MPEAHMATVLVVDDDETLRDVTERILRIDGHDVLTAEHGWEALKVLRDQSVDVIVSDVSMPDIDGVELLKRLEHLGNETPVVIVTGGGWNTKEALLNRAASLGAAATIAKPFGAEQLLAVIRRIVDAQHGRSGESA